MDLEERRRQLAELKAAREAKQRQMERIAQAAVATPAPVSSQAASPSQSERTVVQPESPPRTAPQPPVQGTNTNAFVVTHTAAVDVPPARPECYDRDVETDHCYVYGESRPHPSEVVSKEEASYLQSIIRELQGAEGDDDSQPLSASFSRTQGYRGSSNPQRQLNSPAGMFWDKTGTQATTKTLRSAPFLSFLSRAVSTTSRCLLPQGEGTLQPGMRAVEPSSHQPAASSTSTTTKLLQRGCFSDANVTRDRVVNSLCFQPKLSDAFICALSAPTSGTSSTAPKGLVLVWYTRRHQQQPLKFICDDEVRVVTLSPLHDHLIVAGCATGRIVCWNMIQGEAPILVSFSMPEAHSAAILSLCVWGDSNTNGLLSMCQEGKVCSWQTDAPRRPTHSREPIVGSSEKPGRILTVACKAPNSRADAALADAAKYVCGGVDGTVYDTASKGARSIQLTRITDERRHDGAVTAIDCHPANADPRIAELVLTASSSESACRVWCGATSVVLEAFTDVVHQAKWSPTQPAVFATADASGRICVWNLVTNPVAPVSTAMLRSRADLSTSALATESTHIHSHAPVTALRLQWDDSGEHLICGTSNGDVYYFDVVEVSGGISAQEQALLLSDWMCRVFANDAAS